MNSIYKLAENSFKSVSDKKDNTPIEVLPKHNLLAEEVFESVAKIEKQGKINIVEDQKSTEEIIKDDPSNWNPTEELKIILEDVLKLTHQILFTYTTCFYWYNNQTQQLVLAAKLTESPNFSDQKKKLLGNDIISEAAVLKKVIILNHISIEKESDELGYYTYPQGIHSAIAVPTLLTSGATSNVVGVLIVDSKADDAFGEETISIVKNITHLISSIVKSHSEKFDLISDSTLLKSEHRIKNKIRSFNDVVNVVNQLVEETSQLVTWNALSTILFDSDLQKWVVTSSRTRFNTKYVVSKQEISLNNSIVGKSIFENKIQSIEKFEEELLPRFMSQEKEIGILGRGSFYSIPISGINKCFGALTIETSEGTTIANKEIENIYNLTSLCGLVFEMHSLSSAVTFYKNSDEINSLLKPNYFKDRLEIELKRADDVGSDMTFVLISLSNPDEVQLRYGPKGFLEAMKSVTDIVVQNVRVYDILGRIDGRLIGIILTHTTANEAYIWAEKIRSRISSSSIVFEESSFSVTVSCGVCGAIEGMTSEIIIENAEEALKKAIKTGGNMVGIY
ncbi:MAG: diguanylate cyclase [Bacteroidetes bacterium]|nr:diguanylate cyclase [Bacteroidota bacterium]